jgi:hypothetical protein
MERWLGGTQGASAFLLRASGSRCAIDAIGRGDRSCGSGPHPGPGAGIHDGDEGGTRGFEQPSWA